MWHAEILVSCCCSVVFNSATPWTAERQASLSLIISLLPKFMLIKSVMLSNHLILCRPLLLLPSIFLPAPGPLTNCQKYFSQAKTDIELDMSGPEEWAHSDCKMSFCSGQYSFSFEKQLASLGHWVSAAFVAPALLKVPERRVTNAQRTSAWQSARSLGNA